MKVLCGVLVFRRVAAADVSTFETQAQVHPSVTHLEAFFAAVGCARGYVFDVALRGVEMCAFGHATIVALCRRGVRRGQPVGCLFSGGIDDAEIAVSASHGNEVYPVQNLTLDKRETRVEMYPFDGPILK